MRYCSVLLSIVWCSCRRPVYDICLGIVDRGVAGRVVATGEYREPLIEWQVAAIGPGAPLLRAASVPEEPGLWAVDGSWGAKRSPDRRGAALGSADMNAAAGPYWQLKLWLRWITSRLRASLCLPHHRALSIGANVVDCDCVVSPF